MCEGQYLELMQAGQACVSVGIISQVSEYDLVSVKTIISLHFHSATLFADAGRVRPKYTCQCMQRRQVFTQRQACLQYVCQCVQRQTPRP